MSKARRISVKTLNNSVGSKKAQGLSLNTIIIAIIVLIVLVVVVMIFTGYFSKIFTPSVKSCTAQAGECAEQCNTGQLGNEVVSGECPKRTDGTSLRCCSKIAQDDFTPIETEASCERQGGSCKSTTKNNPTPPPATLPATCIDYGMASFNAPGCRSGTMCCK